VIRRLAGGGAHETFLVDVGTGQPAVAKLPRPHLADDVHDAVQLSAQLSMVPAHGADRDEPQADALGRLAQQR
jgi:hypothetical protein